MKRRSLSTAYLTSPPHRTRGTAAVVVIASLVAANVRAAAPLDREPLWTGPPPVEAAVGSDGRRPAVSDRDENAFISVHLPEHPSGAAAVICPGGGYAGLMVDPEGHGIASWLNRHGVAGIVLEYRLPAGRSDVPWLDAARAIRVVRSRADDWGVDPRRVGIVGFSAGGHLAATLSTRFDAAHPAATDPVDRESSRPDFAILVYPVITLDEAVKAEYKQRLLGENPSPRLVDRFCPERSVTAESTPAFLAHAVDDAVVPIDNSERFFEAQRATGLPAKLLRLPDGGHGLHGYRGASWDAWQAGAIEWLREQGVIR